MISCPGTSGNLGWASSPSTTCRSVRHTAQACTLISSCPGSGRGGGNSAATSGCRAAVNSWACIATSEFRLAITVDIFTSAAVIQKKSFGPLSAPRGQLRETALYMPVKQFLERRGYEVKAEVRGCDLVARRGDEPLVVVELKLRLNLTLILQGVDRLALTERVYLALPRPAAPRRRSR